MNDEEINKAADVIRSSMKNGMLPLPIFNALCETTVLSPVDLYAFINIDDEYKVIVTRRPDDDVFLAGYWHIPGKIMTVADNNFEDTIDRVLETEMPGTKMITVPQQFGSAFQSTKRGKEHVESYWAIVDRLPDLEMPTTMRAAKPSELPEPFLEEQIDRTRHAFDAVNDYVANN